MSANARSRLSRATRPAAAKPLQIRLPRRVIAAFCKKHHVRKLSIFGSYLHGDARPDSDLDVLVEFESGRTPGLAFFGMEIELSELLGKKVDLNTASFLSRYFRDEVVAEAAVQYAAR